MVDAEEACITLEGFTRALDAFYRYVERHAEAAERFATNLKPNQTLDWHQLAANLYSLLNEPPRSFTQALQLLWFAHVFLHVENPSVAISFGRIDQYLWPFLHRDLVDECLTLEDAFDWICAFMLKCCEGEESQNLVLGGIDAKGRDAVNPVSFLFLTAMHQLATFQPSISIRWHPDISPEFMVACCELAAAGGGNPGFMNDPVVIAGLQAVGIAPEHAWDWGIVGCYEATPQGTCYPNTVLASLHLVHQLNAYLQTPVAQEATTIDSFLQGWYDDIHRDYRNEILPACNQRWRYFRELAPSPFGSVLMRSCISRATALETGGADYSLAGVNILGLGTVVDSLYAIAHFVYATAALTVAELSAAINVNFPDEVLCQRLRCLPGRYGTDTEETNRLAHNVSATLATMVLDSRMADGVRPYPGFFAFGADIYSTQEASPDGRHAGELISYGVGASSAAATSATALLASASHVVHARAACGNPLAITLQRTDLNGADGAMLIRHLVEGYFQQGGFHLHINVMSADDLRRAQAHPMEHASLMVRVSGFSAQFITVDARWQDALIERAERGL